jgi:hypothetical protein
MDVRIFECEKYFESPQLSIPFQRTSHPQLFILFLSHNLHIIPTIICVWQLQQPFLFSHTNPVRYKWMERTKIIRHYSQRKCASNNVSCNGLWKKGDVNVVGLKGWNWLRREKVKNFDEINFLKFFIKFF